MVMAGPTIPGRLATFEICSSTLSSIDASSPALP